MTERFTLDETNHMADARFVESVGWVFEHSPWVAKRAAGARPFETVEQMAVEMSEVVRRAGETEQLALLRAHPDLGTRAKISESSTSEQAGAGLDNLTAGEYANLLAMNSAYKAKFGFPFLFAVKGSDKFAIIAALESRLQASRETEFEEALEQVFRIARFRLESLIVDGVNH